MVESKANISLFEAIADDDDIGDLVASTSSLVEGSMTCNSNWTIPTASTPLAASESGGVSSTESPSASEMTFKRWNSMPGVSYNYSLRCPGSSPSSSISDEEDTEESNNSDAVPLRPNIERKAVSFCSFGGRPKSASGSGYVIRNRSSSHAVYLPYRLLDKGIEKLKREANVRRCIETDYAGEKTSITGAALMYSMDEFSIDEGGQLDANPEIAEQRRRTQSLTEPVHIMTNLLPASCSPSPTRVEKQCYSPSMQQVVRGIAMSPTPVPSPTRRHCIRSLSPIALRAGMGLKRKCTGDSDSSPSVLPKRANCSVPTTPPVAAVGAEHARPAALFGLTSVASQSLNHSLSESSIDSECSVSTISSDYTNVSTITQCVFHQHCPLLLNRATTSSPIAPNAPAVADCAVEDYPIAEEPILDK